MHLLFQDEHRDAERGQAFIDSKRAFQSTLRRVTRNSPRHFPSNNCRARHWHSCFYIKDGWGIQCRRPTCLAVYPYAPVVPFSIRLLAASPEQMNSRNNLSLTPAWSGFGSIFFSSRFVLFIYYSFAGLYKVHFHRVTSNGAGTVAALDSSFRSSSYSSISALATTSGLDDA